MARKILVLCLLILLSAAGCQQPRTPVGESLATGRDLDAEGLQASRPLNHLSDSTIRVYEYPDGQFVIDESRTLPGHEMLLDDLMSQPGRRMDAGIVYFFVKGDIRRPEAFGAVKTFCIRHNVDLYAAEAGAREPWQRRKGWGRSGEVVWVVKSRP